MARPSRQENPLGSVPHLSSAYRTLLPPFGCLLPPNSPKSLPLPSYMPPPKRAAADLGDAFSASAIVGGTATGYHLLHIDCYSQTKEELPTGRCIKSCPFSAGGLSWYINYFPNGDRSSAAEFISIFLYLDQSISQPVKARVRFSLLDQAGEPVPSHIGSRRYTVSAPPHLVSAIVITSRGHGLRNRSISGMIASPSGVMSPLPWNSVQRRGGLHLAWL